MLTHPRSASAPHGAPRTGRGAFTLAEILIAIVILATLAAVTIPTVFGRVRVGNTTAVANELQTLRSAITSYGGHVGRYPNRLAYLSILPGTGVTDLCGVAYTAANYSAWRGPYVSRPITTFYVIADNNTVDNVVARAPAAPTANVANYLQINVTGVDQQMATDLQAQLDGDNNFGQGGILWGPLAGGTLTYQIPVAGNGTSGC